MHELIAFGVVGIVTGAAYAVAASGLVVTYSTSGIFNIAHGAIGMLMAFVYWQLRVAWGLPTPVALLAVLLVIAPGFGALVEITLIRRVQGSTVATTLVVTIGLMVGLIGLVETVWKPEARIFPTFFGTAGFKLAGVFVTWEQAITVMAAVLIALGLRLFLYRTRIGIAMRAVVDNRELAALNGARPAWVSTFSWALGASLAALAGILIAPTLQLSVLALTLLVVDAYAAAMVGRLRSLPLTFAGAIAIGLAQSYAVGYMPTSGFFGSTPMQGLRLSIPAILLFGALLFLPQDTIESGRLLARRVAIAPASLAKSLAGGAALVASVAILTGVLSAGNVVRLGTGIGLGLVMLSLVPLTGWGGQVSLCQMTFAGLGAFAMARVGDGGSPLGLLAAAGLAGAVGALVALPALRMRGLYLALATMAFATAMDNMVFPAPAVFSYNGTVTIRRPDIFGLHFTGQRSYVIFLAVVFSILSVLLLAMRRGRFGRLLSAMKDSEAACATLGLSLTSTKLAVFALSAAIAGLAGALYGGMISVAGSTDFQMLQSLPILLLVVVGGVATASGALFGGLSLGLLPVVQNLFPSLAGITLLGSGLAGVTLGSNPDGVMVGIFERLRGLAGLHADSEAGSPATTTASSSSKTGSPAAAPTAALAAEP
jgi:branched-chain amino acid transport system permease protein